MSSKFYFPLDDPPSASSLSSSSSSETDDLITTHNPTHSSTSSSSSEPNPNPNSNPLQFSSDSDSDSDSKIPFGIPITNSSSFQDFDSDVRSPTASDFAIKPSKKIQSFDVSDNLFDHSPTSKRRRLTQTNVINNKSNRKRVWTVEDELMLLQGFIDYQRKIGCSPLSDMDGFYRFTMGCIPGYATKSQLYEKVRRLKKKFRMNSEKVSESGEGAVFIKPHEWKLFELSSKIWGVDGCETVGRGGGGGSGVKRKVTVAKVMPRVEVVEMEEEEEEEKVVKTVKVEEFETLYPYWNAGLLLEVSSALKFPDGVVKLVKENLSVIGEAKAKEMNEKWKAIFENEAVLRKRRIALLSDVGVVETA